MIKKFTGSLAARLTAWFLLISLLPLGVMAVFPRQNTEKVMTQYFLDQAHEHALLFRATLQSLDSNAEIEAVIRAWSVNNKVYLANTKGYYLAHPDPLRIGDSLLDDFSPRTMKSLLAGTDGALIEDETSRIIGYAAWPDRESMVLVIIEETPTHSIVSNIEGKSLGQLALSLVVVSFLGGLAIWMVVGNPLRQLTNVARQIGQGKLDARLDPEEMEDELNILAETFNQMSSQLQELVGGLEARVTELQKTQVALLESEHRFASIFRLSPQPIALSAFDGEVILNVNDEFLRVTGYTREEVLGRTSTELRLWGDVADHDKII
jgi:PAS domain-containing protein